MLPGNPTPVEDFVPLPKASFSPGLNPFPGVSGVDVGGFSAIGTQELLIGSTPEGRWLGISIQEWRVWWADLKIASAVRWMWGDADTPAICRTLQA